MRIGFLTQPGYAVLPPTGSLEIWTREVARRLAGRGHDAVVYASRPGDVSDTRSDGVAYRFVDHAGDARIARVVRPLHRALPANRAFFSSSLYPFLYWVRAAEMMAADGCDVVHVSNYSQALPFVRRENPEAVIALHMQCEWLTQLPRSMVARRLAAADLVLGCSRYITGKIATRFPELPSSRLGTLYNGVATDGTPPAARARRDGGVRLLHVGRISPEKGHHLLIEAFNALVERHPDLTLTLVGDESPIPIEMAVDLFGDAEVEKLRPFYEGGYVDHLRGALSERARERVRFAGRVSHEETATFYQEADVFVFPSIFEAFPIPPIEAMAAGLPVVATSVGGTVESVRDGETGLLVPRADAGALTGAIERLVSDGASRATMGAAGRRRVFERFSWDSVCDSMLQLVERRERRAGVAA